MRRLLVLLAAVPALVVLAAPPASAGCADDYVAAMTTIQARPWIEVDGYDVTIRGSQFVNIASNTVTATTTFADCVT